MWSALGFADVPPAAPARTAAGPVQPMLDSRQQLAALQLQLTQLHGQMARLQPGSPAWVAVNRATAAVAAAAATLQPSTRASSHLLSNHIGGSYMGHSAPYASYAPANLAPAYPSRQPGSTDFDTAWRQSLARHEAAVQEDSPAAFTRSRPPEAATVPIAAMATSRTPSISNTQARRSQLHFVMN